MSFFPSDYKDPPKNSPYMNFENGDNKFRALSQPVFGWEYWIDKDGKRSPVRVKNFKDVPVEKRVTQDKRDAAKYFIAFLVWNYKLEKAQILEIKQQTIISRLRTLDEDPDWGDVRDYDITVKKIVEGDRTKYEANQKPKVKFNKENKEIPEVNLEALFTNENPFTAIGTAQVDKNFNESAGDDKALDEFLKPDPDLADSDNS